MEPPAESKSDAGGVKKRGWCFTLQWPCGQDFTPVADELLKYAECWILQGEIAPITGRHHLQGFVYFKNARKFQSVKTMFGAYNPHLEQMRGKPQEAWDYCQKPDSACPHCVGQEGFTYGVCPRQGPGKAYARLIEHLDKGATMTEMCNDNELIPVLTRSIRSIERIAAFRAGAHERGRPTGFWVWGPTGTCKSFDTRRFVTDVAYTYTVNQHGWFDGYDGQVCVLIDEFDQDTPLNLLLKLFDRSAMRMPIKGGFVAITATCFVVSSNLAPGAYYHGDKQYDAWLRRIAEFFTVWEYPGDRERACATMKIPFINPTDSN